MLPLTWLSPCRRSPFSFTLRGTLRRGQGRRGLWRSGLAKLLSPACPGWFVQQHRELELMNSFRDRFGRDWLQYRNHLQASGTPALGTVRPGTPSPETVCSPPPPETESAQEEAEEVEVEPEPREEEEGGEEEEEEEEGQEPRGVEGECAVGVEAGAGGGARLGVRRPQVRGG